MFVLGKWKGNLDINHINSINDLDASMINDLKTISNLWLNVIEEETEKQEIEFF